MSQFAICINTDDPDLLTPRTIYEILPDESAARSNYIRVIDNEGEDYLYPADYFVFADFPQAVEQVLLRISRPTISVNLRLKGPSPGRPGDGAQSLS